jgi:peroxiredoxin
MRRVTWLVAVVLVAACAFLRLATFSRGAHEAGVPDHAAQHGLAPDFRLRDIDGSTFVLSDHELKPVAIGFFCGCDDCNVAARAIAAEQKRGVLLNLVAVVGLDRHGAAEFQRSTGLRGRILVDDNGSVATLYDALMCPQFRVVSQSGTLVYASGQNLRGGALAKALGTASALSGGSI